MRNMAAQVSGCANASLCGTFTRTDSSCGCAPGYQLQTSALALYQAYTNERGGGQTRWLVGPGARLSDCGGAEEGQRWSWGCKAKGICTNATAAKYAKPPTQPSTQPFSLLARSERFEVRRLVQDRGVRVRGSELRSRAGRCALPLGINGPTAG